MEKANNQEKKGKKQNGKHDAMFWRPTSAKKIGARLANNKKKRKRKVSCRTTDGAHGGAAAVNLNATPIEIVTHIQDVVRVLCLIRRSFSE